MFEEINSVSLKKGCLYVVATPIGNLQDISLRALQILKSVDAIAAEDTRHSQRLLHHFDIKTPCFPVHEYNEQKAITGIISRLKVGETLALISDAGTPLIQDPGYHLVAALRQNHIPVIPIPGPCAAIAALCVAGLPTDSFVFYGFLPAKGQVRQQAVATLKNEWRTAILYESVHRIDDLLQLLATELDTTRPATIARELTKTFETIQQGSLAELYQWFSNHPEQKKGEFVIVLAGAPKTTDDVNEMLEQTRILKILLTQCSLKQSVELAVKITGGRKKILYDLALKLQTN